ncbi:MAG TPA: hypothetical protein VFZ61_33570 [Polyangiales bacterium]
MPALRPELDRILAQLLAQSADQGRVELDTIGEALGVLSVSTDEIDALIGALEAQGREVVAPSGGGVEQHLGSVVQAVRALSLTLARKPTLDEVAAQAGIGVDQVRMALALLRVMQRSPRDLARK